MSIGEAERAVTVKYVLLRRDLRAAAPKFLVLFWLFLKEKKMLPDSYQVYKELKRADRFWLCLGLFLHYG